MFVLAIDTATPAVTAGIVEVTAGQLLTVAEHVTVDARRHVEALLPQLRRCLSEAELSRSDLTAVVTGTGPGPFTGLRVGMATAQAFADAAGLPLYGVCSLDAVAYAALHQPSYPPGPLLVATDARRAEVYWSSYDTDGARLDPPAVDTPAALRERLDNADIHATWSVGEGAVGYADTLGLPVHEPAYPSSVGLVNAALERISTRAAGEQPRPLYLRRPDAVPQAQFRSGNTGTVAASTVPG
ncbi:MAG: tRNA (adenosine(37)-N6)-threonylcarbamoyltransferase complex dimerization subunit type 1 TsaB [Mycobacteriales bacterium]